MRKLSELQQEIESVRFELDQALLRQDKFDNYYQKSTKLDQSAFWINCVVVFSHKHDTITCLCAAAGSS